MLALRNNRGTTLLEAVVAASLLVTLAVGTASLILLARRLGDRAEQLIAATTLAAARLEALRAIPWQYDIDGAQPEFPGLAFSPADALNRNSTGFWDATDESGQVLPGHAPAGAAFVRRWSIVPALTGPALAKALEVCVYREPVEQNPVPLACLASARTRQP
jgi:type II secretory pathway pseudopilin PulG